VTGFEGKTITLKNMSCNDFVSNMKTKIQEQVGVPPDQQRLYFARKELKGNCKLETYSIKKHSTIDLNLRILGGGSNKRKAEDVKNESDAVKSSIKQTKYDGLNAQIVDFVNNADGENPDTSFETLINNTGLAAMQEVMKLLGKARCHTPKSLGKCYAALIPEVLRLRQEIADRQEAEEEACKAMEYCRGWEIERSFWEK